MNSDANVDLTEIAKFEAIASRWWDMEGEFKPLHQINPVRLDWITDHSGGLFGKRIVDIGCGGGILSESMARRGAIVTGIDMGKEPLGVARLHALEQGVELDYQQMTAEQHAEQAAGQYDIVTCMEMLEHVPDPASVLRAIANLVRPGGRVFVSTINRNPKSYLMMIIGAEYLLKMVPKGTHNHQKFITPAELCRMAESAGLVVQDMSGVHYAPLTNRFKLGANVDVNYMVTFTRPAHD
ncbi:bifunctional 2-polyprenyl-6-hydroxyphenol methylase/3-demethylubiquinol 3-O-methyltransferase UbiG [Aeromonas cavernicola]|uniref:Ubiquinone biosynthesis O-methyltransferase n=1 Tax=Aeromonas cavernicola TaxID=1006623 RepID=A0A2H9U3Q6_9GAMM|nr:bifunctional 2-polyprenyl-6-hydroxyphenol methylase/3-demethylubiquinol 3-O-methyltransferase UbiG [Aeromonas cavernicola]PJG58655.1 bifunctional 3-demethylubiquinol 3-O-methyltransferase/2-polyprenyl-6-hydroxyphenol methylase [Aeromonas cavernicola]